MTRPTLPSEDLMFRVAGSSDPEWFWKSGGMSIDCFNAALGVIGKKMSDFPRILEFGCGCGRILLHTKELGAKCELHGSDIDATAIAWAKDNIPWAKCGVNDGLPPLKYPDGHFDLIFNHSVFTHLDEKYQDAWLAELHRVAKPGGTLLLTVSGDHPYAELEKSWRDGGHDPSAMRKTLDTKGILFIEDDIWKGGPFPDFYHSTFHAPWYVFKHWTKTFELKAYIPRGSLNFQDLLLLQRRA